MPETARAQLVVTPLPPVPSGTRPTSIASVPRVPRRGVPSLYDLSGGLPSLIPIRELRRLLLGGYLAVGNRKDRLGERLVFATRVATI